MARIVCFTYGGDIERPLRRAFAAAGHDFRPIEPDFPQCKPNVDHARPEAFLLDVSKRASHVRETAAYFADLKAYRQAPVFAVDCPDEAFSRIARQIPRAARVGVDEALAGVQSALSGSG